MPMRARSVETTGEARGGARVVRAPVRALDAALRRRLGIVEFSQHPDCLLRVSRAVAPRAVTLADGTRVAPGAPLLQLHLWNERVPPVPPGGPDLRWGRCARARFEHSLRLLARHVAAEPALADIAALWSPTAMATHHSVAPMVRIGAKLGLDIRPAARTPGLIAALRRLGEGLLAAALVWAYNPQARRAAFGRVQVEMWMSRAALLARYGTAARGAADGATFGHEAGSTMARQRIAQGGSEGGRA